MIYKTFSIFATYNIIQNNKTSINQLKVRAMRKQAINLEVVSSHKGYTYYIASAKFREGKYVIYVKDKDGNTANRSCFCYPKNVAIEICRNSKSGEIQEIIPTTRTI